MTSCERADEKVESSIKRRGKTARQQTWKRGGVKGLRGAKYGPPFAKTNPQRGGHAPESQAPRVFHSPGQYGPEDSCCAGRTVTNSNDEPTRNSDRCDKPATTTRSSSI